MTTTLEAVAIFWAVTVDLLKSPDQEEREANENFMVHKPLADKWWVNCVVNEFDPDEFLRITKDFLDPDLVDLLEVMIEQVDNIEDKEEEGA